MGILFCTPRILPQELEESVRRRSIEINPDNAKFERSVERAVPGRRGLRRLALLVGTRWPATKTVLSVQFLDNPRKDLRARLLSHMNAWSKTANIRFAETQGNGEVRIARYDRPADVAGYWSWVGTQILAIPEQEPTMNLEGFTMKIPESEFRRVVRHETGHTLGFDHEHMRTDLVARIDRKKAIAYFRKTENWSAKEVDEQVLTPLKVKSIMGTTEADPLSIMCYQIPGEITKDGKPIPGGKDINRKDYAFAAKIYPKSQPKAGESVSIGSGLGATSSSATAARRREPSRLSSVAPREGETLSIFVMAPLETEPGVDSVKMKRQPRFAQVFASYSGAQVVSTLKLSGEKNKPTAWRRIIAAHERIKRYTNREQGDLLEDNELLQLGRDLFDTLMYGDVLRLYDEARARQHNSKLDVVLTSMIPWVAEKPWEFAYDSKRRSFLATEDVNLVRNVVTAVPSYVTAPQAGPLRILVVSAQPVGLGRLSVEEETDVIRRGFNPLIDAGLAVVEVLPRATPGRLHGRLSTSRFDVVHFIGHGIFDEQGQEGALFFEDDRGNSRYVGARTAREIFCRRGVNLIFLNACQSGSGGRKDFNLGVAQSLVEHGIPAVVANQYSVLDTSATSFAQHFYWSLAQGMSLGRATTEARIAVNYTNGSESIDWAVPVLLTRSPNLALCLPSAAGSSTPTTSVSRTQRKAIQVHKLRVALWDTDSAFPYLEKTLERLNASQQIFGFELVSLSIPIRAWDIENRATDGGPYLWAERLERQVKHTLPDLHADMLTCITAHWMRDNETMNLFSWGSSGAPVTIFSCAGLDLKPTGNNTDRAVANILVSLLLYVRGDLGSHQGGSKSCPLYYNEERDRTLIVGRQKLDERCLKALKKKLPEEEVAALEVLLSTFS